MFSLSLKPLHNFVTQYHTLLLFDEHKFPGNMTFDIDLHVPPYCATSTGYKSQLFNASTSYDNQQANIYSTHYFHLGLALSNYQDPY